MNDNSINAIILGSIGLGLVFLQYRFALKGKDGSGWGFIALFMFIGACSRI